MAPIVDGISANLAPAVGGKRALVPPSPPSSDPERGRGTRSVGGGEGAPQVDLGRRFEARGQIVAEAIRVRQYDKKLGQVASDLNGARVRLEQVKLYPPYPIDEPRRAQAIRQFNGLAAEAARLVSDSGAPRQLSLSASTEEASAAIDHLQQLSNRIDAERVTLRGSGPTTAQAFQAEATSAAASQRLGDPSSGRIARGSTDVLRQIA